MEAAAQPRRRSHSRLEAIEASMDCRISRIEDYTREIRTDMKAMRAEMRAELNEVHNKIAGFKIVVVTTAIAAVLSIASLNAALTSNMLSAFQAGVQNNGAQKAPAEAPASSQ